MSSIKIQQISCPVCGGQLNNVGPFSPVKKCMYCHNEIQVSGSVQKEMPVPERMLVFNTNEEDFERAILNLFVEEDYTPNDIFDIAAFKDLEGIYLPMYLYEGKYECAWNCSVGYYENEIRASSDGKSVKNKKVLRYRPQNGSNRNNYAIVCAAYEGEEVKSELIDYARALHYDSLSAKAFDEKHLEGFNFVVHNMDKESTWDKYGIDSIKYLAESEAISQIPGDHYKDFRCSVSHDAKHDGRLVFLPFWMVYYDYNGEQHYAIMDGTGNSHITGSTPVDQERVKAVQKWHKIAKYVKWAAIASFAILFIDFSLWEIIALMWIGFGVLKIIAKINERKIIKSNRKIRQQKMSELGG